MLKSLMFVTVYVSDQDRALEFYTEKLGLRKRIDATGGNGRFLTVAPGEEPVEIILWPADPGLNRPAGDPAQPGGVPGSVFLESDDLAKDFEVLRSRGVTFVQDGPTPYPFGVLLTAIDPDGNYVELRQPRRDRGTDG
jgi:catechol 2,3-dioxygenase-like lactoylglutathione lyase family enzyme